ncbi:unnamed protein product [Diamesa tonsa]
MNLTSVVLFFLVFIGIVNVNGYKILGVFPTPGKSHWIIGHSVMKTLAKAGHSVTVISAFPLRTPMENYRDVSFKVDVVSSGMNMFESQDWSAIKMMSFVSTNGAKRVNLILSQPNVQELLKVEKFDAVVIELFWLEALMGLGAHFDCPVIGLSMLSTSKWTNDLTQNPSPASYVPNNLLEFTDNMNFWQRTKNMVISCVEIFFMECFHYPTQSKLYQQHFGSKGMTLDKQMKNVSLVLINHHFTASSIRPLVANMIEIGGIHVDEAKELPKDIKDFLDSANEGVIYFSMGSIVQGINWPVEKREMFINCFAKLKQKVLWKYENETLPGNPGNIMIGKWLPQRDILSHPNVKVFITHGGLLGTTEAVVEGIPVLGIPIYGDQRMNMKKAESKGYGILLDYNNITESSLTYFLNEIINNPKYLQNSKKISRQYNDRQNTPHETTLYWIEYVIRHQGAPHLRSAANNLNFWQLHLIDVYAFLGILIFFFILITFFIGKCILKCLKSEKMIHKLD